MVLQGRVRNKGVNFMKHDLRNLLEAISVLFIVTAMSFLMWLLQEGYKKDIVTENETIEIEPNGRSGISNTVNIDFSDIEVEANVDEIVGTEEPEEIKINAALIRCTGYLVTGTTASGEYTEYGVVAGKREWLGRYVNLYSVDEEGDIGNLIGTFQFLDTGAGIDTDGDGYGDSIINGTSIDVWHPSDSALNEWRNQYGDYVYMELLE